MIKCRLIEMERMKKLGKRRIINTTVLGLSLLMAPSFHAGRGRYGSHRYYFARKVTVINQDDNSEIVLDYPILDLNSGEINPHYIVSGYILTFLLRQKIYDSNFLLKMDMKGKREYLRIAPVIGGLKLNS